MKVFIDTNVLLDWISNERPQNHMAEKVFAAANEGLFQAFISSQSIIDVCYSARKNGVQFARFKQFLQSLRVYVKILAIDEIDLSWAIEHYTGDFEDDAQWACAYNNVCDYFITRDKQLLAFNTSSCPMKVISPVAFVEAMEA